MSELKSAQAALCLIEGDFDRLMRARDRMRQEGKLSHWQNELNKLLGKRHEAETRYKRLAQNNER